MSSNIYQADKYAKLNQVQRSSAFEHLVKNYDFISSIPYPMKVLDVGCGTGENTKLFTYLKNVSEIQAFDIGADMIEYAKKTTFDSRVTFNVANVQDYGTWPNPKEAYFDFAVSFYVLHWVPDNKSALKNIYRSLRPGGYFMARILGKRIQNDKDLYQFAKSSPKWNKYAQEKFEMLDQWWMEEEDPASAYGRVMKKIGFENISCKNIETSDSFYFGKKEETKEYITMSRLRHFNVPEEDFDEFATQCTDAFLKCAQINENGDIKLAPAIIIEVLAQKPKNDKRP